jgi:GNAT superfamily N-acetyltransferase
MSSQSIEALPGLIIATDSDVPAVVSLINLAFRGHSENAGWSIEVEFIEDTRITEDLLREDIAAKPYARLLLWHQAEGVLLGCVWLEPQQSGIWYLGLLAVDPLEQKAGLGRKLLQAAERWAEERGATEIRMTVVHLRAALIDWYKRRGYVLTGETKPFPYGDNRYGTPKRDDLYFVVLRKVLIGPSQEQIA